MISLPGSLPLQLTVDRLLDNRILGEHEVDVVVHVALQVDLRGVLDTQDVGVEDAQVCGAPLGESQPRFQKLPSRGIQEVEVGLMDVVHCKMELQGWEDVSGVDGHLVLSSNEGLVKVRQLLLQLGFQEVEVVGRRVEVGDVRAQELVGVVFHSLQKDFLSVSCEQEELVLTIHLTTLYGEGAILGGLEAEAH